MYEQGFSPEAEVSRAMEKVLAVERSTSSAVKAAAESADTVRRAATEQAQRIIVRTERRIIEGVGFGEIVGTENDVIENGHAVLPC